MRTQPIVQSLLMLALLAPAAQVPAAEKDPASGFVIAEGWETVRNNCTACHSSNLVIQNSGSRNYWQELIRWMQATQGLWQFDAATEKTILDYLSTQYGAKEGARRPPLPRAQMPENPYKPTGG